MRNILHRGRFLLLILMVLALILPGAAIAQETERGVSEDKASEDKKPSVNPPKNETVPDQIIVKFKEDTSSSTRAEARNQEGLEKKKDLDLIKAEVDKVKGQSAEAAIRGLERRSDVEYATPDRRVYPTGYADEPRFAELWGLDNKGQRINGSSGTSDVDMNGKEASTRTQGDPNRVVAVIDTGVDFSHPDLASRVWKNPGESGSGKETNGIDDDSNGKVDDVNGWDFFHDDQTVYDAADGDSHGTHVSGTIAASVNAQGVVGVAPNVKVMSLKFLSPGGGSTSDAIDAIGYAKSKGVKISNNSWGCYCFPEPPLKEAIDASGQLFVASAGNNSADNDVLNPANYPASYGSANILSVAAIDNQGSLASFSSYGAKTVDISAPGVSILSSVPGGSWAYKNGTSMAAPHVSGTAALVASKYSTLSPTSIKSVIMSSSKKASATTGKTVTSKMVNALAALYPRVTATSPKANATGVTKSADITATFSEAMDATSISTTTFTLLKTGTTSVISATVNYDATTKKATLNPSAELGPNTSYTATVKGGTSGVKNAATPNDPMKASKTWKFTTGP